MPTRTAFEDVRKIHKRWLEARLSSTVPRFEDVVVGNVGQISHEMAVLKSVQALSPLFSVVESNSLYRSVGRQNVLH